MNDLAERLERAATDLERMSDNKFDTDPLRQAAQALRGMGEADELLRDEFAMAALSGLTAGSNYRSQGLPDRSATARVAYEFAGAMMSARSALKGRDGLE